MFFPTQNGHGYFGQIINFGEKHVFEKSSWDRLLFLKCGLSVFLSSLWEQPTGRHSGQMLPDLEDRQQEIQISEPGKQTLCCSLSTNMLLIQAEERMFFELIFQGYKWIYNDFSTSVLSFLTNIVQLQIWPRLKWICGSETIKCPAQNSNPQLVALVPYSN